MTQPSAWRPLGSRRVGPEAFTVSPFARLARAHSLSAAGDALIALALADSLFFSVDPGDARWRIALYLLLTMAPFAVVSPLIGPALDRARGGRRLMVIVAAAGRALACVFMIDDVKGVLLYPEAFAVLVLSKGYAVAKSALVPTVVATDEDLVEANSKLSLLSGLSGFAAAVPGVALLQLGGAGWVLGMAVLTFTGATILAVKIPRTAVAEAPPDDAERSELRSAGILLSASAMALLRGVVGFLTFLLAFALREDDAASAWFGAAIAASMIGMLAGALIAPHARRSTKEEHILVGSLLLVIGAGLLSALAGGKVSWAFMAGAVGLAASSGKLAFDAIVQRDAPDANRGRSFARFETRFQIAWVVGALVPVVIPLDAPAGFVLIAMAAGFAVVTYLGGQRAAGRGGSGPVEPAPDGSRGENPPEVAPNHPENGERSVGSDDAAPLPEPDPNQGSLPGMVDGER